MINSSLLLPSFQLAHYDRCSSDTATAYLKASGESRGRAGTLPVTSSRIHAGFAWSCSRESSDSRPGRSEVMRWFDILRTVLYVSGFVLLWGWVPLSVGRFDPRLEVVLPVWVAPIGAAVMALGAATALTCGALFAVRGRGTPAPFDPPREFVAVGPYRWVRNPMYLGALLVLVGLGLWLRSPSILVLALLLAISAHLFVVNYEEPGLERRFGASYVEYKKRVNRWIPRPGS